MKIIKFCLILTILSFSFSQAYAESGLLDNMNKGGGMLSGINASKLDVQGVWQSNWSKMVLQQSGNNITGTYETSGGKIYGDLNGNILTGFWTQSTASQRCTTAKYGSNYWGHIKFDFSQGKQFSGNWGYCDNLPTSGGWTGNR